MRKRSAILGAISWSFALAFGSSVGCGSSDAGTGGASTSVGTSGATPKAIAGSSASGDHGAGSPSGADGGRSGTATSGAPGNVSGAGGKNGAGGASQVGVAGQVGAAGGAGHVAGAGNSGSSGNGAGGAPASSGCDQAGLVWKSANKTNYTSYPAPGSDECVKFSGCLYEGLFAACDQKKSLEWVQSHNIVAAFPDLKTLELHDLCLKSGNKTIVVTVYDTCADTDCSGCCTQNKGNKDELIDIESFTDARWGVADGAIQWADLGPSKGMGCD